MEPKMDVPNKSALVSGWAVQSALLILKGAIINNSDGLDPDFR